MDIDRRALEERMNVYLNISIGWEEYKTMGLGLECERAGISPREVRTRAQAEQEDGPACIVRYGLRPFDSVWACYFPTPGVWNRSRPAYWAQCWEGNSFFMTRFRSTASPEGCPFYHVNGLSDDHFIVPDNACIPIRLRHGCETPRDVRNGQCVFEELEPYCVTKANLSETARSYATELGAKDLDLDAQKAGLIWMHALAIGYSPVYLSENADGIRQDWPRVPLPDSKGVLEASDQLGRRIAALLDVEHPVKGVTAGRIRPELKGIGVVSRVGGGALDPDKGELDLTADWGHAGQGGVCMPGKGKWAVRNRNDEANDGLGAQTYDVYLNDTAFWANIPERVWDYTIGGYQVIKKWLSYREKALLGRGLRIEEVEYVTGMARRIAALVLLEPDLDANYERVKSKTWPWPK